MKRLVAFLLLAGLVALVGCSSAPQPKPAKTTYSSFDLPAQHPTEDLIPAGMVNFQGVDVSQVLEIYSQLARRTIIRGSLPNATINFHTTSPVSRIETLQMLDTVLAENGIVMILMGDSAIKAVPAAQAPSECPPEIDLPWQELPDSSSYMTRMVHFKDLKAVDIMPVVAPFSSKLPGAIVVLQKENALILRDYAANIKAELRLIEALENAKAH